MCYLLFSQEGADCAHGTLARSGRNLRSFCLVKTSPVIMSPLVADTADALVGLSLYFGMQTMMT